MDSSASSYVGFEISILAIYTMEIDTRVGHSLVWIRRGFDMNSKWILHGFDMDSTWIRHEFDVDSDQLDDKRVP